MLYKNGKRPTLRRSYIDTGQVVPLNRFGPYHFPNTHYSISEPPIWHLLHFLNFN